MYQTSTQPSMAYYFIILITLISEDSPTTISNMVSIPFSPFNISHFIVKQTFISCILGFYTPVLHGNISKLVLSENVNMEKSTENLQKELELENTTDTKKSASYLDLHLEMQNEGEIKKQSYDKCNGFTFPIVNSPFTRINIPAVPV